MEEIVKRHDGQGGEVLEIKRDNETIGEMMFTQSNEIITVHHTEVNESEEGQGYAKQLLDALVADARRQHAKIRPFCPYVLAQFRRHPEDYADVWDKPRQEKS